MSFDPYAIFIAMFFSLIGYAAWRYGKQTESERHLYLAIALMAYGYVVSNIWLSLGIGTALTVLLFWP
jgi:hypothetical protein